MIILQNARYVSHKHKYWLQWAPETGRGNKRYTLTCSLDLKHCIRRNASSPIRKRGLGCLAERYAVEEYHRTQGFPQIQGQALVDIGAVNAKLESDV